EAGPELPIVLQLQGHFLAGVALDHSRLEVVVVELALGLLRDGLRPVVVRVHAGDRTLASAAAAALGRSFGGAARARATACGREHQEHPRDDHHAPSHASLLWSLLGHYAPRARA